MSAGRSTFASSRMRDVRVLGFSRGPDGSCGYTIVFSIGICTLRYDGVRVVGRLGQFCVPLGLLRHFEVKIYASMKRS